MNGWACFCEQLLYPPTFATCPGTEMELLRTWATHAFFKYLLAGIWVINGFFCKILGLVPRHERIVAAILGEEHSGMSTIAIGISELLMAAWILSGWRYRLCAEMQIAVIASMNVIEFITVPHLLLWGNANAFFALLLIGLISMSAFVRRQS